jgi:hypothetical protein
MHLVRLLYCSESVGPLTLDTVHQILHTAKKRNPAAGITGFLCFDSQHFLQALEGPATAVNRIYRAISRDARHTNVTLLGYGEIPARAFPQWAMGDADLAQVERNVLEHLTNQLDFLPAALKADQALALLSHLEALRRASGETDAI